MQNNEGEILRKYIRSSGKTQEEFAELLSMTRQNLGYHMRKDKLDRDFLNLLKSKGIDIFSKMEKEPNTYGEAIDLYEKTIEALEGQIDVYKKYTSALEEKLKDKK